MGESLKIHGNSKDKIKKTCPVCKKIFLVYPSWATKINCSRSCSVVARIKGSWTKCLECGKDFFAGYWKEKGFKNNVGQKFCNKHCSSLYNHRNGKCSGFAFGYNKKENHWNWRGGINPNSRLDTIEWKIIKKKAIRRDGCKCKICGIKGVELVVHHIIPWNISHDDSLANLKTLCKSCHSKEEAKLRRNYEELRISEGRPLQALS